MKTRLTCSILFLLAGTWLTLAMSTAQSSACRGTTVETSSSPPALLCGNTCDPGTCAANNGTGDYAGYKICNCGRGQSPNGCCQLALKLTGSTWVVVTLGDCISCGFEDKTCTKVTSGSNVQPMCVAPAPPPTPPQ